jgi:hypothetical protein
VRSKERVHARGGAGSREAGVNLNQFFLPVAQPELRAELRIAERGAVRLAEGGHDGADGGLQEAVLLRREEARAQDGAQGPVAEEQLAAVELVVHLPLALAPDLVVEEGVVEVNGFPKICHGSPPIGSSKPRITRIPRILGDRKIREICGCFIRRRLSTAHLSQPTSHSI